MKRLTIEQAENTEISHLSIHQWINKVNPSSTNQIKPGWEVGHFRRTDGFPGLVIIVGRYNRTDEIKCWKIARKFAENRIGTSYDKAYLDWRHFLLTERRVSRGYFFEEAIADLKSLFEEKYGRLPRFIVDEEGNIQKNPKSTIWHWHKGPKVFKEYFIRLENITKDYSLELDKEGYTVSKLAGVSLPYSIAIHIHRVISKLLAREKHWWLRKEVKFEELFTEIKHTIPDAKDKHQIKEWKRFVTNRKKEHKMLQRKEERTRKEILDKDLSQGISCKTQRIARKAQLIAERETEEARNIIDRDRLRFDAESFRGSLYTSYTP